MKLTEQGTQVCLMPFISCYIILDFRIRCIMGHIGRTSEEIQTAISSISEPTSVTEMAVQLGPIGVKAYRESTRLYTGEQYRQETASHLNTADNSFS